MTITVREPFPPPLPTRLNPGAEVRTTIDDEPVVIIGSAPHGFPVILSPQQWETLKRWKLSRLTYRDHVRGGDGITPYNVTIARFLTGISGRDGNSNKYIRYRNGNPLDCRPSNLLVMPRHYPKPEPENGKKHPHDIIGKNLLDG